MDVKFLSKSDLAHLGISVAAFLELITKIDEENGLLEEPFDAVVDRLTTVFDDTEDMWRAIMIDGKVKGYWNCVALDDKHQKLLEEGELLESYINKHNLKKDLHKEKNALLFDSVCLDKHYQKKGLSGLIYKSIYDTLRQLPSKNCDVSDIWASIWSDDGIVFFSRWGFAHHKKNAHNGAIYRVSFDEAIQKLEKLAKA